MGFSALNLHPLIEKALVTQGYETPTPIQSQAIPTILAGKDVSAAAATGSGKTAAFILPALDYLQKQTSPSSNCKILILTPTRELAIQIADAAKKYGKFLKFKIVCLVGGMSYHHQIRDLSRGADLIIATPGRLLDHHDSKRVNLSNVSMFILDEADRMVDMGFIDDVNTIEKLTAKERQTLLFSATLDKRIHQITKKMMKEPTHIDLSNALISADHIQQIVYKINSSEQKIGLLKEIIEKENIYKGIIFSATKSNADRLADVLTDAGWNSQALHGDLKQGERNRVLKQFRDGESQFLVATDVASRGIHIDDLTHVINFDVPKSEQDYVHRIGRTGRAGQSGIAITFVTANEFSVLNRIEKYMKKALEIRSTHFTPSKKRDNTKTTVRFSRERSSSSSRFKKDGKPSKSNSHEGFRSYKSASAEGGRSRSSDSSSDGFRARRTTGSGSGRSSRSDGFRSYSSAEDGGERSKKFSSRRDDDGFRPRRAEGERSRSAGNSDGFRPRRAEGERSRSAGNSDGFRPRRAEGERSRSAGNSDGFRPRRAEGERSRSAGNSDGFRPRRAEGERSRSAGNSDGFRPRRAEGERSRSADNSNGFRPHGTESTRRPKIFNSESFRPRREKFDEEKRSTPSYAEKKSTHSYQDESVPERKKKSFASKRKPSESTSSFVRKDKNERSFKPSFKSKSNSNSARFKE